MKRLWLSTLLLCTGGCAAGGGAGPFAHATGSKPADSNHSAALANATPSAADRATLSVLHNDGPLVAQLDVYQLRVPFGALSRNAEFWKRVDETRLDVATYDLLLRNGVRIGIGANADWAYFKQLIDEYHATAQRGVAGATQSGALELMMKTGVDYQDLFYFDDHNRLWGRTFEHCDDAIAVNFFPHPRAEGDTVVKICPLVRGLRKQFEFTVRNEEREIELRRPEQIFDLRATAQVPAEHFFIVGPSAVTDVPSNLGLTFLVKPGNAEPLETILLLVPRAYRIGEDSIAVPVAPR